MKKIVYVSIAGLLAGSMVMMSSCASTSKCTKKKAEPVKKEATKVVTKSAAKAKTVKPEPTPMATKAKAVVKAPVKSAAPTAAASLEVLEIAIAKAVQDREAVDVADTFTADVGKVFCWTKLTGGAEGKSVIHRWKKDGVVMAEITLNVTGSPWRTYSSKAIMPEWKGNWSIEIVDAGNVIKTKDFVIQ